MNGTLIARLRDTASKGVSVWGDLQMEAADLIEELQAELKQERTDYASKCAELEIVRGDLDRLTEVVRLQVESYDELREQNDAQHGYFNSVMQERDQLRAEVEQVTAFKDGAYLERNKLVALLSKVFPSGKKKTAIEGWSEDWHGCVYIDLPTGQASWHYHDSQSELFAHLPEYQGTWDGHTTDEKYERISQFASGAAPQQAESKEAVLESAIKDLARWLEAGATISKRDGATNCLVMQEDGSMLGGLHVEFPQAAPTKEQT